MRYFVLVGLLSLSVLQTAPNVVTEKTVTRYDDRNDYAGDYFDCSAMLQYSAQKLEQFTARIQALAEQENDAVLVPANENEEADIVIAYAYFLITLFRLRQEAECIIDENASMRPIELWYMMGGIFAIFPKELQLEAVGEALEFVQEHAQDTWAATEQLEHYKPAAEWPTLRANAAAKFTQFLHELAKTLQ